MLSYFHNTLSSCSGPASSPFNVSAQVVSSTRILVGWEEVPPIDRNGIITQYEIEYIPLETFNGVPVPTLIPLSAATRSHALIQLEEYVLYNISVRAITIVGSGPFSIPLTRRTLEDSKSMINSIILYLLL